MFIKIRRKITRFANLINIFFSDEVLLVYQMGKVGSTSLYYKILEESTIPVLQIHRFRLIEGTFVNRGFLRTYLRRKWASLVYKVIRNKRIKIVSMTREPVSRNVSDFFQTLDHYLSVNCLEKDNVTTENLINIFKYQYPQFSSSTWFDEQVFSVFGIDVYSQPMNNGYGVYKKDNVELFLFRMEDINSVIPSLSDFLCLDIKSLNKENSGSNKWYSSLYMQFKKDFNKEELSYIKETRYYKYFYEE